MGARIRVARETAGLSQVELGARVGVKQQSVQKWESGASSLSARRLEEVADALGVPVGDLLGDIRRTMTDHIGMTDEATVELSASGVDLEELHRLDPEQYDAIMRQAELALDRARQRRLEG